MKPIVPFIFILLLSSCNHWSDEDSIKFMEQCEKTKWEKEFCDCAIDKVKLNYNSFAEISEKEGDITTILLECIE